ncbi:MAG: TonB-dependent receptor [Gemmatimonadaceae bacterium]|jgi:iron complex outermembrane receptor protein|nr:TonB-dependent receptor [Gemmatimonadaceae bacterium]
MLLCIAIAATAESQPSRGAVAGRVRESGGAPVAVAQIVARTSLGTIAARVVSDDDGRFRLDGLTGGQYAVEAVRAGYDRVAATAVTVRAGETSTVDLVLSPVALTTSAVVITSTRRVDRLSDTDASIQVVPGTRVTQRNEPTVFGALRQVPGLDTFDAGLGQQQVNARGFVNPFTSNMLFLIDNRLATLPGLGTVLPGMVTATSNDIAQVEVVTGPTSSLYGPNAGNGVVHLVTRDPRESAGRSLAVTTGERNTLRVSARAAGVLGDRFGYKLSGDWYDAQDFEQRNALTFTGAGGSVVRSDRPDFGVRNRSVNGALYWYPGAGSRVTWSGGLTRANYINLSVVSRIQAQQWDAWYQQVRANLANVLGGSLFVQAYYTANDAGDSYYLDLLERFQAAPANGGRGLSLDAARRAARFVDKGDRLDAEVQHTVQWSGKHFLTTGAQFRRSRPNSEGTYLVDTVGGPRIQIDESGAYVGYDNLMLPKTRLSAVARVDQHSDIGSRFSPKVSATVTVAEGHTLRATYNQAFNSPNFFLLYARSIVAPGAPGRLGVTIRGNRDGWRFAAPPGAPVPAALAPLEALDVRSAEVGYRGAFAQQFVLDVTGYRTVYENYISKEATITRLATGVFAIDPASGRTLSEITRSYINYGRLPVLGTDVAAQWLPTPRVSVSGSVSYQMPGTFSKPAPDASLGLAEPPFNAPTHKYKLATAYREWWRAGTYVELSGVSQTAFRFESALDYLTGTVPGYTVANLDAGVPIVLRGARAARVGVAVRNLFDRRYREIMGGALLGRVATVTVSTEF